MKHIRIAAILFTIVFGILLSVRLGVMDHLRLVYTDKQPVMDKQLPDKDVWMNVLQDNRKIGYAHSQMLKPKDVYLFSEELFLRIKTMGIAQDLNLIMNSTLSPDLTLLKFDVNMNSGVFQFKATGRVEKKVLTIETDTSGEKGQIIIPIKEKPFVTAAAVQTFISKGPLSGESYTYTIFDPAAMATVPVTIKAVAREDVTVMNQVIPSTKIAVTFKGMTQYSWVGDNGDVLIEEGVLGMRLEKTTKQDALHGMLVQAGQDLTELAAVTSNVILDAPSDLKTLKVRISGLSLSNMFLEGGRQSVLGNLVTIQKENLLDLSKYDREHIKIGQEKRYLVSSPVIQSDHPDIIKTMTAIVAQDDTPFEKARKIIAWIQKNIKKQPVLSFPDALTTLKNRVGDCNEHAVLTAALLRAADIPAEVESGLVYMNGRFYYHAWNRMYLGKWITADAVFGQMPADVTHIRFSIGAQEAQVDLLPLIGRIKIEVIHYD